jgi:hypothetical protein
VPSILFLECFFENHHIKSRYLCKLNGVQKYDKVTGIRGMPVAGIIISSTRRT